MKNLILAVLLILSPITAKSDVLTLDEVFLDYKSIFDGARDPLITQNGLNKKLDSELNLNINMSIMDYMYWDNMIHSLSDQSQFRLIGWNYRFGIRFSDYLEVGFNHFSQHFLDYAGPNGFPMYDAIEVKLFFYRRKSPGKGLFF